MCSDLRTYLEKAIIAHNSGRLDEAKKLYLNVLKLQPKHPEANHNMGTLALTHGQNEEAKKYFGLALSAKPNVSQFWLSYINILIELNYIHKAQSLLKKAQAIGIKAKALEDLIEKLRIKNLKFNNLNMKTISILVQEGKFEQAIIASNQLLADFPNSTFLKMTIGNCNAAVGRFEIALKYFEKVLEIEPKNTAAIHNLANCYKDLGDLQAAIKHYKLLININPSFYEVYYNLGNALRESRKLGDAVVAFRKVLSVKPNHFWALNDLALTLKDLGKLNSAIKTYDMALKIRSNSPEAIMNQGLAYLMQKDFAEGWWRYEYRLKNEHVKLTYSPIPSQPQWEPNLSGRVLLWAEQGLGDVIMFASIVAELYAVVDKLIIQVDGRLIEIFKRSFPSDIIYYSTSEPVPENACDFQIPFGSLPQYFRTDLNSFQRTSAEYLKSDQERTIKLRKELLCDGSTHLIGLSWRGGVGLNQDIKTVELPKIVRSLPNKKVKFINLQYGDTQKECDDLKISTGIEIHNVSNIDNKNDIDGLLSLINACDQVVTISNVTAHLAGAIGKNTSILVALSHDWRWGMDCAESYWYSSIKLYRQKKLDDWSHPLSEFKRKFNI